jgi:hypothetical protein
MTVPATRSADPRGRSGASGVGPDSTARPSRRASAHARSLEVFERGADGRYVRALARVDGRVEPVPGYAGLAIDLDALWAEADELGE